MSSIDSLTFLYGAPIVFYDLCLIYPPKLSDLASIGVTRYAQYAYLLTLNPRELEESVDMDSFDYLIRTCTESGNFTKLIKDAFYFFIQEPIFILSDIEMIQIGDDDMKFMDKKQFTEFQAIVKQLSCFGEQQTKAKPKDEFADRLAKRLEERRKEVERIKAKKGQSNDIDLGVLVSAMAARIPGLNILNIWDLPYIAFEDQLLRMRAIEDYDIKIQARLAGAKIPDKEMEHWIRKIQKSDMGG